MKTRRAFWRVGLSAVLLSAGVYAAHAQSESDAAPQTNTPTEVPATAAAPEPAAASQAAAPPSTRPGRLDFSSFGIITARNIFNGNRSGQRFTSTRSSSQLRSVQVESFTLVGTLLSSKDTTAFFDGTDHDFRKVLRPGGTIAGFQLKNILPSGVRLMAGTNEMDLRVGNSMRREDRGPWRLSTERPSYVASSSGGSSSNDSDYQSRSRGYSRGSDRNGSEVSLNEGNDRSSNGDSPPSPEMNAVLKRLMEQREKEIQ